MSSRRFKAMTGCIVCTALLLTACSSPGSPTVTPRPPVVSTATASATSTALATLSSEAIVVQLTPAATLGQAVDQLVSVVGTTTDTILVRVHPRMDADFCYDCDKLPPEYAKWEHEGVPLADVPSSIAPGSVIWLILEPVACYYTYDGTAFTPRFCQTGSSSEKEQP